MDGEMQLPSRLTGVEGHDIRVDSSTKELYECERNCKKTLAWDRRAARFGPGHRYRDQSNDRTEVGGETGHGPVHVRFRKPECLSRRTGHPGNRAAHWRQIRIRAGVARRH